MVWKLLRSSSSSSMLNCFCILVCYLCPLICLRKPNLTNASRSRLSNVNKQIRRRHQISELCPFIVKHEIRGIMLRQRKTIDSESTETRPTTLVESIRQFDAFAKVPEKYTKSSKIGGVCKFCLIAIHLVVINHSLSSSVHPESDINHLYHLHRSAVLLGQQTDIQVCSGQ